MQKEIHPAYAEIKVTCSCGNTFQTRSTIGRDLHLDICSKCHPFYTGQQKIIDSAGRVERFRKKYEKRHVIQQQISQAPAAANKAEEKTAAKKPAAKPKKK